MVDTTPVLFVTWVELTDVVGWEEQAATVTASTANSDAHTGSASLESRL